MAIRPGMHGTRLLGLASDGQTLLKARLRTSPEHPRAVGTLLQALALWEGTTVHGVLVAGGEAMSCDTNIFRECFADLGRPPLYELEYIVGEQHDLANGYERPGAFADLRELFECEGG
jgi:hypothetical protein